MILVTGGAGHIGNVLVRDLVSKGENVRVLALSGENVDSLDGLNVEIVRGNILDVEQLREAMTGARLVFHLASFVALTADKYALMHKVNVEGTANVISLCNELGVERLVYTSSIHAFERVPEGVVVNETLQFDTQNPDGLYDRTKAEATLLVLDAVKEGLDAVVVCPTGVVGPYDYKLSELGEMIITWMKKRASVSTDGAYDFVDVRDVSVGHILAAEKGVSGEVYILGGERLTIKAMRSMVQAASSVKTMSINIPAKLALFVAPIAEFFYKICKTRPKFTTYSIKTLLSNSHISYKKAIQELGYQPRKLKETIKDTVEWLKMNQSKLQHGLRMTSVKRTA
jgi:dihydroflavonol-4-reductase